LKNKDALISRVIHVTGGTKTFAVRISHPVLERVQHMSIASSQRTSSGLTKSHDVRILVSVAFVAIAVVVAICALAAHQGVSAAEIGLMSVFP
jgi:hypothetical protein